MKNYYEVIGVSANATKEQIKKAYHKKLKQYHPDVFTGDKEICQQITEELNKAYQVLRDDEQRKVLDTEYGNYKYKEPKKDKDDDNKKDNKSKLSFNNLLAKIKSTSVKENKEPSKVSTEVEGDFSSAEVDSGVDQENKPTKTKDLVILNAFIYGFVALMIVLIIIFFIV